MRLVGSKGGPSQEVVALKRLFHSLAVEKREAGFSHSVSMCNFAGFTSERRCDSIDLQNKSQAWTSAMSIETLVARLLGADNVVRVEQEQDENRDGETILRLNIVLLDSAKIDGETLLDLGEQLRAKLAHSGVSGFPVVRYLNESEHGNVVAAE